MCHNDPLRLLPCAIMTFCHAYRGTYCIMFFVTATWQKGGTKFVWWCAAGYTKFSGAKMNIFVWSRVHAISVIWWFLWLMRSSATSSGGWWHYCRPTRKLAEYQTNFFYSHLSPQGLVCCNSRPALMNIISPVLVPQNQLGARSLGATAPPVPRAPVLFFFLFSFF
jgi:hypothetical protein